MTEATVQFNLIEPPCHCPFFATLVALHFTPVSESVSQWAEFRTSVASRLVSLFQNSFPIVQKCKLCQISWSAGLATHIWCWFSSFKWIVNLFVQHLRCSSSLFSFNWLYLKSSINSIAQIVLRGEGSWTNKSKAVCREASKKWPALQISGWPDLLGPCKAAQLRPRATDALPLELQRPELLAIWPLLSYF